MTQNNRNRSLTTWQFCEMLCEDATYKQLGAELLWCVDEPGTLERKPTGFDFNRANVSVWHGEQRVWAITWGVRLYELAYGIEHPFCDVELVEGGVVLEVREG